MFNLKNHRHYSPHSVRAFICALVFGALGVTTLLSVSAQSTITITASTDGTDVTSQIQSQIDAAPNGSTIVFPVGKNQGRYRVNGRLELTNRSNLTIMGPSPSNPVEFWTDKVGHDVDPKYVWVDGKSTRQNWRINDSSNITLRNLYIKGPNTYRDAQGYTSWTYNGGIYEGEHGIVTRGCNNITIEDTTVDSWYGDGIAANNNNSGAGVNGLVLRRVTAISYGRHGFSTQNATNVLVDGITTVKGGTNGVALEPNGIQEYIKNVEIKNSTIDTRIVAFPFAGTRSADNVWIHHNTVKYANPSWPMFFVAPNGAGVRRSNIKFENNAAEYNMAGRSISIKYTDNISINNNIAKVGSGRAAISGVGLTDVGGTISIRNNDFGAAPTSYTRDDVPETPGIDACGNITAAGSNRPIACAVQAPSIPGGTPPPNVNNNPSSGQTGNNNTNTGSSTSPDPSSAASTGTNDGNNSTGSETSVSIPPSPIESINNIAEKPIIKIKNTSFRVGHLVGLLSILFGSTGAMYYLIKHKNHLQEFKMVDALTSPFDKPEIIHPTKHK